MKLNAILNFQCKLRLRTLLLALIFIVFAVQWFSFVRMSTAREILFARIFPHIEVYDRLMMTGGTTVIYQPPLCRAISERGHISVIQNKDICREQSQTPSMNEIKVSQSNSLKLEYVDGKIRLVEFDSATGEIAWSWMESEKSDAPVKGFLRLDNDRFDQLMQTSQ